MINYESITRLIDYRANQLINYTTVIKNFNLSIIENNSAFLNVTTILSKYLEYNTNRVSYKSLNTYFLIGFLI